MKTHKKYLKLHLSESISSSDKNTDKRRHLMKLIDDANYELERYYHGKYKFQVSEDNNGVSPDDLQLSPKKKRRIKEIWLRFDSDLSKIQRQYEKYLQTSLQNDNEDV